MQLLVWIVDLEPLSSILQQSLNIGNYFPWVSIVTGSPPEGDHSDSYSQMKVFQPSGLHSGIKDANVSQLFSTCRSRPLVEGGMNLSQGPNI